MCISSNNTCEACKIKYNELFDKHCCKCKKIYPNIIVCDDTFTTYLHCCECNLEYNDNDEHKCDKKIQ